MLPCARQKRVTLRSRRGVAHHTRCSKHDQLQQTCRQHPSLYTARRVVAARAAVIAGRAAAAQPAVIVDRAVAARAAVIVGRAAAAVLTVENVELVGRA